jgi:nicotinamidase/pyrazinamidase
MPSIQNQAANPHPLAGAPAKRIALIAVDVQNDFADPAGSLFVRGAPAILDNINLAIDAAHTAGSLVVYTQDWHPAHTPHFAPDGGIWPVHCLADSWGAALHPRLRPDPDGLIRKGADGEDGYSAFSMRDPVSGVTVPTPLHGILSARGIVTVIVCGLATDYCVKATAVDAVSLGYLTLLELPAIAAVDLAPGDGQRAIDEMAAAGVRLIDKLYPAKRAAVSWS